MFDVGPYLQVIRLLREWGCDSFRKDFATKAVTGKMLHEIDSVSHELLQGAPSSVRKDFYARLQQAKKNGLSRTTATNVAESPTSKLRRVRCLAAIADPKAPKSSGPWQSRVPLLMSMSCVCVCVCCVCMRVRVRALALSGGSCRQFHQRCHLAPMPWTSRSSCGETISIQKTFGTG